MTWVALALAGGCGAWLRFTLDARIRGRQRGTVPLGTLVINIIGSFLLAMLTGYALHHPAIDPLKPVLGTGLLGGFTTFSTATVEWVNLYDTGRPRSAAALALGMLAGALAAGACGLAIGWWL